jgi:hypothetical protein
MSNFDALGSLHIRKFVIRDLAIRNFVTKNFVLVYEISKCHLDQNMETGPVLFLDSTSVPYP